MHPAQCDKFTGCAVGAEPPWEASSALCYNTVTMDFCCWIPITVLLPESNSSCSKEFSPNQIGLDHSHTEGIHPVKIQLDCQKYESSNNLNGWKSLEVQFLHIYFF